VALLFGEGAGAGSPSNTKSPGPRPLSVPSGIQSFGHDGHGPKIGGLCPFLEAAGSPSNIMAGAEAYSVPACEVSS